MAAPWVNVEAPAAEWWQDFYAASAHLEVPGVQGAMRVVPFTEQQDLMVMLVPVARTRVDKVQEGVGLLLRAGRWFAGLRR